MITIPSLQTTKRTFSSLLILTILSLFILGSSSTVYAQSTHTVAPGDTMYSISRRYGVSINDLIAANSLINPNFIKVGQIINIPGTDGGGTDSPTPTPAPSTPTEGRTHVVSFGQTVATIARLYGVTISDIANANQLLNINLIYVGQVLNIPGSSGSTPTTPTQPTPTPTTPTTEPPPSSNTTHTVAPGDTLGAIASRYGVTVQSIVSANGLLSANLIYVGQVLVIPGASGGGTTTPPPANPGGPVTTNGTVLGGQTHTLANPGVMKDAGMTWVKFQHKWGAGNNPADLQGRISNGHSNGLKVLLSIPGANTYPSSIDFNGYIEYLRGVASLEDPPDAIEVWNEMNIDFEWPLGQINPTSYVNNMLAPAYNAIKGANPNIMVISGAPAPTGFFGGCSGNGCDDDAYIRGMAAAGATRYMDCMGVHFNAGATSPSATTGHPADSTGHYSWYYGPMVNTYSAALGRSVPLCFTEVGYLSTNGFSGTPPAFAWASGTSVDQHAQWLAEAYRLAANDSRVTMFIVFNVDFTFFAADGDPQAGYAIIRPDGSCPACATLKAATGG